ncbi:MAG: hypothetical protein ACHP84_08440 [Caulobacterales bacterium]
MRRALALDPRWEETPRFAEIEFGGPDTPLRAAQPFFVNGKDQRTSARRRVLLSALIVNKDFKAMVRCRVDDVSDRGARLKVPDCFVLPPNFWLIAVSAGLAYEAKTIWRRFPSVGVSVGEPIDLDEPLTRAGRRLRTFWVSVVQ